jgi:hypothetical protein
MKTNTPTTTAAQISKLNAKRIAKIDSFDSANANAWERLQVVTAKTHIANLGLNKALKDYLFEAKDVLTDAQIKILAFKNVVSYVNSSEKYNSMRLFSLHTIQIICSAILKSEDKNIARAIKSAKQQAKTDKK